jgi:hypothetical protein
MNLLKSLKNFVAARIPKKPRDLQVALKERGLTDMEVIYYMNYGRLTEKKETENYLYHTRFIGYLYEKVRSYSKLEGNVKDAYNFAFADFCKGIVGNAVGNAETIKNKEMTVLTILETLSDVKFRGDAALDTYFNSIFKHKLFNALKEFETNEKSKKAEEDWYKIQEQKEDIKIKKFDLKTIADTDPIQLKKLLDEFALTNQECAKRLTLTNLEYYKHKDFVQEGISKSAGSSRTSLTLCRNKFIAFLKTKYKI